VKILEKVLGGGATFLTHTVHNQTELKEITHRTKYCYRSQVSS